MNYFKITFEDGNHFVSGFNGTFTEALHHWLGRRFQFGDTEACPRDKMVLCTGVQKV